MREPVHREHPGGHDTDDFAPVFALEDGLDVRARPFLGQAVQNRLTVPGVLPDVDGDGRPADHLVAGVSGEGGERFIDVDDNPVLQTGDQGRVRGGVEDELEALPGLLCRRAEPLIHHDDESECQQQADQERIQVRHGVEQRVREHVLHRRSGENHRGPMDKDPAVDQENHRVEPRGGGNRGRRVGQERPCREKRDGCERSADDHAANEDVVADDGEKQQGTEVSGEDANEGGPVQRPAEETHHTDEDEDGAEEDR